MSSQGTGSPITAQEASDLLHKLVTESTKVQVAFTAAEGRVKAAVPGRIKLAPDGTLWVMEDHEQPGSPLFIFDPGPAVVRKYEDFRAMLDAGEGPFGLNFRSLLGFIFKDGSAVSIFEFPGEGALR